MESCCAISRIQYVVSTIFCSERLLKSGQDPDAKPDDEDEVLAQDVAVADPIGRDEVSVQSKPVSHLADTFTGRSRCEEILRAHHRGRAKRRV